MATPSISPKFLKFNALPVVVIPSNDLRAVGGPSNGISLTASKNCPWIPVVISIVSKNVLNTVFIKVG
jgi:hypothetical protein